MNKPHSTDYEVIWNDKTVKLYDYGLQEKEDSHGGRYQAYVTRFEFDWRGLEMLAHSIVDEYVLGTHSNPTWLRNLIAMAGFEMVKEALQQVPLWPVPKDIWEKWT